MPPHRSFDFPFMSLDAGAAAAGAAAAGAAAAGDISRKDQILLSSVLQWFNEHESRVTTFSDIVNHRNGLSLRIIDWLITNFSKAFSVAIETDGLPRNLCKDYHKNLSAHNKKNFDPFARRRRIHIVLFREERRVSTIGQLNFFRWFLSKGLVDFLLHNKSIIEKHMKDAEGKSASVVKPKTTVRKAACVREEARGFRSASVVRAKSADHMQVSEPAADPVDSVRRKTKAHRKISVSVEPQLYSGTFTMSF